MRYIKNETNDVVDVVNHGTWWTLRHQDGNTTRLSDTKFRKRYTLVEGFVEPQKTFSPPPVATPVTSKKPKKKIREIIQ